jgi:hypothetical protein
LRGYLSIGAALALAGCAAQGETAGSTLSGPAPRVDPAGAAGVPAAAGGYKLTAAEMQFDCPRLTGQMKVRMANMRAHYSERSGTATSQAIQTVIAPIYGGTRRGIDPMADLQLDRAKLEAFNRRLAEKKCKTLDIDAELRGEPAGARSK